MSATVRLPYTRFVRRVSSGASLSKYGYIGMMNQNGEALKSVPWTEAASGSEVTLTTNQLTKTDGVFDSSKGVWTTEPSYTAYMADVYDAFNQAGDAVARNATMCGYAGCVAYRFKIPTSETANALESISLAIQRDRYLRAGVRVALCLSDSELPSDDWAVVRGEATGCVRSPSTVPAAGVVGVSSFGFLGQAGVEHLTASAAAADALEFDTSDAFSGAASYQYLWVYLSLEDYGGRWDLYKPGEVRQYYIEGSAMLISDGCFFTFAHAPEVADVEAFNVVRGGVCQSLAGAVSGFYGVEVLRNGDDLADMAFSEKDMPVALSSNMALMAGSASSLRTSYDANLGFSGTIWNVRSAGSSSNEWRQTVLVWASGQYWGQDYYAGKSSKVIRAISLDGTNGTTPIGMSSMTDADIESGIAFAWIEGRRNWNGWVVHAVTNDGVEIADEVVSGSGNYWWSHPGTTSNPFLHTRTTGVSIPVCICREKPLYFSGGVMSSDGLPSSVSVVGTVKAIRSIPHVTVDSNAVPTYTLVVSGNLTNVGGVPCKNCAIVTVSDEGVTIERPSWDEGITPDVYDGFCVTPVFPNLTNGNGTTVDDGGYVVTGSFTKLGTVAAQGCALLSDTGTITPKFMPGTTGDLHFVDYMLAVSGDRYLYRGRQGNVVKVYPDSMVDGLSGITDEQSCIGLRALYAKLYTGGIKPVTIAAAGAKRYGAGFVVDSVSKTIHTMSGGELTSTQIDVYRMSIAAMSVPFSVPITFPVRRVRVSWGDWLGSATGGRFNVWMRRGEYALSLPDATLRKADMYIGSGNGVNGWEFVGSVDATLSGTNRTKTFNLSSPLTSRVATIMLTAFLDMDSVNPSSGMTMPQGVATEFSVDPVSGVASYANKLWVPDITLLG